MSLNAPICYIVEPKSQHVQSFILLHGLGSNGRKFGEELLATAVTSNNQTLTDIFAGARFIFPTAKRRRSSAFRRAMINQWFDIASLDDPLYKKSTQYEGLSDSAGDIMAILEQEIRLVGAENIIFGGLSHGCAMSLSLLLCLHYRLGAFIGMSGWLPFQDDLMEIIQQDDCVIQEDDIFGGDDSNSGIDQTYTHDSVSRALKFEQELLSLDFDPSTNSTAVLSTPVFIGHGEQDEKINLQLGKELTSTIQAFGMDVTFKTYHGQGHWYKVPEEIDDIVAFLRAKGDFVISGG